MLNENSFVDPNSKSIMDFNHKRIDENSYSKHMMLVPHLKCERITYIFLGLDFRFSIEMDSLEGL